MVSSLFLLRRRVRQDGSSTQTICEKGEETVNEITTIGLDLAKPACRWLRPSREDGQAQGAAAGAGEDVLCEPARVRGGDEGCASAHYWARELGELGHEVRLVPAQHVKAYVRGNKNDYNDARAIAEAAQRPDMRLVRVKTVEQQDVQLHRMRAARVAERTALCNDPVVCWPRRGRGGAGGGGVAPAPA